jgi:phosphoesterase RecJ-like protein
MTDLEKLAELLKQNDNYVLTTHVNPDADAIGSVIAMKRALMRHGKRVRIINCSETPDYLKFLDKEESIEFYQPTVHDEVIKSAGVFIALDFNRIDRMIKMAPLFPEITGLKLCIDHHQEPEQGFDDIFGDTSYCATGHILYDFIKKTNFTPIDFLIAEPIYAAIVTDTGQFSFERTTADVLRIAAELVEAGVVPIEMHGSLYSHNSPGKLLLLGHALNGIKYEGAEGQVGVMTVTQEALRMTGTKEDETDQFVNMIMSVEKVQIGLKFLELPQGFKVSLRSKGAIPIHEFAGRYGGGGHRNASGVRIRDKALAEMKDAIIASALEFYENWKRERNV